MSSILQGIFSSNIAYYKYLTPNSCDVGIYILITKMLKDKMDFSLFLSTGWVKIGFIQAE